MKTYQYEYSVNNKGYLGSSLHESDNEAINYYRSLEENGQLIMKSLKNQNGFSIWSGYKYGRPIIPGLQPKFI